jgi:hypothetical protein
LEKFEDPHHILWKKNSIDDQSPWIIQFENCNQHSIKCTFFYPGLEEIDMF